MSQLDKDGKEKKDALPKEQRTHMIQVILADARKKKIISSRESLTKSRLSKYILTLNLQGKELIIPNRQKHLVSQDDKALELLYKKVGYKAVTINDQMLDLCLAVGKSTGTVRRMSTLGLNTLVDYAIKEGKTLSDLNKWICGISPNTNKLANQNFVPFVGGN